MGIQSPFNVNSSASAVVDKMLGNAYPVVREVYGKLGEIAYVVANTEAILEAGNAALNVEENISEIGQAVIDATTAKEAAEAALNTIESTFYGALSAVPTLRPDGSAMQEGDRYYNTTLDKEYLWNGAAWSNFAESTDTSLELVQSKSLLLASLAADNSWKTPYWTLIPHPANSAASLSQSNGFDEQRSYIYMHNNKVGITTAEAGIITRYAMGAPGELTALDYQPASDVIGHSGCAVERATGKLWTDSNVAGYSVRFTYTPGGVPTFDYYKFSSLGNGKVSISYDQKYIVWQKRTGSVIYNLFFLLSAVIAHGPGDVSSLVERTLTLNRDDHVTQLQAHGFDGQYLYTTGNISTNKDPGRLTVQDINGNIVFDVSQFNPGQAAINVNQPGTHWEIESLDFVKIEGNSTPCIAFSLSGDSTALPRNKIYLFGSGQNQDSFIANRPIEYIPTLTVGDYATLLQEPEGAYPKFQYHGSTETNSKSLHTCFSASSGSESGRILLRSTSGVVGSHGNTLPGDNIYADTFWGSFGGAWVKGLSVLAQVGTASTGFEQSTTYIPMKLSLGFPKPAWSSQTPNVSFNPSGTVQSTPVDGYAGYSVSFGSGYYGYEQKVGSSLAGAIYTSSSNTIYCAKNGRTLCLNTAPASDFTSSFEWRLSEVSGSFYPSVSGVYSLGNSTRRVSQLFASTATIDVSDERLKEDIEDIDAAVLRAWSKVKYQQYKFKDAVAKKGSSARWHFGVVAQKVKEAFESEGLDAFTYGLLCYDEWGETAEIVDEKTGRIETPYQAAGNVYGIRYEEALALECAYLRSLLSPTQ
jgi:hypothetical protein